MNNTTTNLTAIVAVFMAATLVVGTFAATTTIATPQTAFAYQQKKKMGEQENSRNGNTVTIQKCKQAATESGFDNTEEQECANLICTHPGNNATCSQEGVVVTPTPTLIKKTCEQCFTTILTPIQISEFLRLNAFQETIPELCADLETKGHFINEIDLREDLTRTGIISVTTQNELITCLRNAGIVIVPLP